MRCFAADEQESRNDEFVVEVSGQDGDPEVAEEARGGSAAVTFSSDGDVPAVRGRGHDSGTAAERRGSNGQSMGRSLWFVI